MAVFYNWFAKVRKKKDMASNQSRLITLLNAKRAIILLLRSKKEGLNYALPVPGLAQQLHLSKNNSQKNGLLSP